MLFPTHPAAGYLLALVLKLPPLPVLIGASLPDLIDKPLGMAGITDRYQTISHSLIGLAIPAILATRSRTWLAMFVGWFSHLGLDALHMVLNDRPGDIAFLGWPIIDHDPAVSLPPLEFAAYYSGSRSSLAEIVIWLGLGYALVKRYRS